ncbi:MAG: response regulator [Paludibacteraceae bacterium]|nr:response regulator [Paludibacteraceae bacterium]
MSKIIAFLFALLFFIHIPTYGESRRFSLFEAENGAPYSDVNHLFEDSYGFLWISTWNGLIKFDGYKYKTYTRSKTDNFSLPHNVCYNTFEDSHKRLWISTARGLAYYDRTHDNFRRIALKGRKTKGVSKALEDKDGYIWMLCSQNVLKYNHETKTATEFEMRGDNMEDCGSCIWVCSVDSGVSIIDKKSEKISQLDIIKDKSGNAINKHIRVIKQISNGDIYLGSTDNGLFIYDKNGRLKRHETANPSSPYSFRNNFIQYIYEDRNHKVWISNMNGNISNYDPERLQFTALDYIMPNNIDKNCLTTSCILQDSYNNIWLGTHRFWLLYSNRLSNEFSIFQHNNTQPHTISGNAITCFSSYEDNLLVGADGGGLNIQQGKGNNFIIDKNLGKIVLDIKPENENGLFWIATWDNGLYLYDFPQKKVIKHYTSDEKDMDHTLPTERINYILVEKDFVWIATDGKGVALLNKKTGEITSSNNSEKDPFNINNSKFITHLMKDSEGWLWISSSEGLRKYKNGQQINFSYSEKPGDLPQNQITMCMEDKEKRVWIITSTGSLVSYDRKANVFINYAETTDIPENLKFITSDKQNNLWIGSQDEIIQFNPDAKKLKHYSLEKELERNFLYQKSVYLHPNGEIYFGSNDGMFKFNPTRLAGQDKSPKIYLKDIYIWDKKQEIGKSEILSRSLSCTDTIRINHKQNYFTLEYVGIDLEKSGSLHYSYFLKGLHHDWIEAGKERKVSFTNLEPGTYTFLVRVKSNDGQLFQIDKPLTIIILPSWWQTWWFKTLSALVAIALIVIYFTVRIRNLRKQKERLEILVANRTIELRQKNQEIEKQKESVESKNKELDETLSLKNRILSIIAHDLKNPVTAIVGMLSFLSEEKKGNGLEEKLLTDVTLAAQKLQEQMDNILQWARIQTKDIFYSPKDISVAALTKDSLSLMQGLATNKRIDITMKNSATHYAFADERMIATVIRNLINNAIKFTHSNGKIEISIDENEKEISFQIKDSGVGMSEEKLSKIFEKDFNASTFGTNNEKGSGLGLKICYDFVIANKGEINIKSKEGEGTTIQMTIPLGSPINVLEEEKEEFDLSFGKGKNYIKSKGNSILIVDDNPDILSYLTLLFQNDFEIEKASDGETALELALKDIPDIIISDVVMPKMDGKELCRHLKNNALTQHIPIILLTSEDSADNQIEGLNLGADDYITKPFDGNILLAKVHTLLQNRKLQLQHLRNSILAAPEGNMPESKDDAFLRKITEILQKYISEPNLSVEFIADKTALSRVQLFRKFKAITGCSPSEYVKNYKLQYAATLLKSGKYSVADVAYEVGFSDPKYFGSCFSEKFNMAPSVFAKQNKDENG